jgi:hypothetical protein
METEFCFGDLGGVVGPGLDGIVLPKVETAAGLLAVDWVLGELERERDLPARSIDHIPIIETGKGLANIREILRAGSRVRRVAFGAGDFTFDMNIEWTADEAELAAFRAEIALASSAAGIEAPLDSVWIDLQDSDGERRSAESVRRLGYQGKMCIHPDQVAVVNDVFTPDAETVASAERIVAASLLRGRFTLAELEPETLSDPAILALADKVDYEADPESGFPRYYDGEVVVRTRDGRTVRHREPINRGNGERPLSDADIVAKFSGNAVRTLSPVHADRVRALVLGVEDMADVNALAEGLRRP